MIRLIIGAVLIILAVVISPIDHAYAEGFGIGYISKGEAKVYTKDEGAEIDQTVKANFPLVAYDAHGAFGIGKMASESESNGRLHVRYWLNGKDASEGENTGWVDPKEVIKFPFDCCDDSKCSGIKAIMFKTRTYTDCFNMAASATIEKQTAKKEDGTGEIEKLKLLLEIEKLKLEQEKLKSQNSNQQPSTGKTVK